MGESTTRIAIILEQQCKPKKCRLECKKFCPVVRLGASPRASTARALVGGACEKPANHRPAARFLVTGCSDADKASALSMLTALNIKHPGAWLAGRSVRWRARFRCDARDARLRQCPTTRSARIR